MNMLGSLHREYVRKIKEMPVAPTSAEGDHRIRDLEDRLDRLTLVCMAMWQLIQERTSLTEEDLATRVAMIDAADGVADGKRTESVQPCPACKRPMSPRHRKCLYCGYAQTAQGAFDTL